MEKASVVRNSTFSGISSQVVNVKLELKKPVLRKPLLKNYLFNSHCDKCIDGNKNNRCN